MKSLALTLVSLLALYSVNCDVYFEEKFPDGEFCDIITHCNRHWHLISIFNAVDRAGFGNILNKVFRLQIHGNPVGSIVSTPVKSSASSN